ncbi:MAG TPA: twin-arginine translocase TatA/TatE family subunit [Arthrobacter sp.]|jgi:TatA/E family protein of Tat protein translocase|nr:twin-arginine translocase TatA/TatE family subunit [Arthrobacter sp.]
MLPAFLGHLSPIEWLLMLALSLLFFGRRLPEVARSLGKGITEFKQALSGVAADPTPLDLVLLPLLLAAAVLLSLVIRVLLLH